MIAKLGFLIAKCKLLIANVNIIKVAEGVGHPDNKTSFVGFVYIARGALRGLPSLLTEVAGHKRGEL